MSLELLELLKKEKKVIKGAPIAFSTCVVVLAVLAAIAIYWLEDRHYDGTISALRGTIDQKEATIKIVESDRDRYRNMLQDAGIVSTPLKKTALTLAEQLKNLAYKASTNSPNDHFAIYREYDDRFDARVIRVFKELDEHGCATDKMNEVYELSNRLLNPQTQSVSASISISAIASEMKRLAEQLKE